MPIRGLAFKSMLVILASLLHLIPFHGGLFHENSTSSPQIGLVSSPHPVLLGQDELPPAQQLA